MPNHVHGIIFILEGKGTVSVPDYNSTPDGNIFHDKQGGETPPLQIPDPRLLAPTLGQIVAYFKYQTTKEMNAVENTGVVTKFWQRNTYEHLIRAEIDLQNKTDYIEANPLL